MPLVVLRFQLPHQALTELHDTSRSAAPYMGGLFAYGETYDSSCRRSQRLTRPGRTGGLLTPATKPSGRTQRKLNLSNTQDPEPRLHRLTRMSY